MKAQAEVLVKKQEMNVLEENDRKKQKSLGNKYRECVQ